LKEYFEKRTLTGPINVACKFENQPTRFWSTTKEDVVRNIAKIVNRYAKEGETLTLRQLHYQFVGHVPGYVNHDTAYKKLGDILDDLRYCGIVPWNSFEDRGRKPYLPYSVKDIPDALQDTVDTYRIDRQEDQPVHVELWTEKYALSAIFSKITSRYHVRLVINKGYTSSTAAYEAYSRFAEKIKEGKKVVVLYFGDHDPSGLDMVRDIRERIGFFLSHGEQLKRFEVCQKWLDEEGTDVWDIAYHFDKVKLVQRLMQGNDRDGDIDEFDAMKTMYWLEQTEMFTVKHIGLTMEQVIQFNLPENPTKMTDSRAQGYIQRYGRRCWEVDAIDLVELRRILQEAIEQTIDMKQFNKIVKREKKEVNELKAIIDKFEN
jgi:hypothetical protein